MVSTGATYSPWVAGHISQLVQVVRWVALPGIFSFSNLIVYSEVVDRARALEQKMSGFEIGAKADRATEQLNPNETGEDGKASRYIGVHFRLSVRNRDREADSTVELIGCDLDIPEELERAHLFFSGDSTKGERRSTGRDVPAGCGREFRGQSILRLPENRQPIPQERVRVTLKLTNTWGVVQAVSFDAELSKRNDTPPDPAVIRGPNWATGWNC